MVNEAGTPQWQRSRNLYARYNFTVFNRFTATYNHAGHPGFFIHAINNTFSTWEEDRSYWEILDGDLNHTPVGKYQLVLLQSLQ